MKRLTPLLFLLAAILASCEAQPVYAQPAAPGRTEIVAAGKSEPTVICYHYSRQCRLQPGHSLDEAVATMLELIDEARQDSAEEPRHAPRVLRASWRPKMRLFAQAAPPAAASKPAPPSPGHVMEYKGPDGAAHRLHSDGRDETIPPATAAKPPEAAPAPVLTDGAHEPARLRLREPQLLFFSAQKDMQMAATQFYAVCGQLAVEEKWPPGTQCGINDLTVHFPASPESRVPSPDPKPPAAKPPADQAK
jgi:hypothetical protein